MPRIIGWWMVGDSLSYVVNSWPHILLFAFLGCVGWIFLKKAFSAVLPTVRKHRIATGLSLFAVVGVAAAIPAISFIRENRQWELTKAASSGDLPTVIRCVKAGASIDREPDSPAGGGEPALVAAAWDGHDEVIRFLLDHGARINVTDSGGNTALMAAANRGRISTVGLLLSRGADPNIRGEAIPIIDITQVRAEQR